MNEKIYLYQPSSASLDKFLKKKLAKYFSLP